MQHNNMDLLVSKAKNKDPDAFTELMKNCTKDMYKAAVSILMNDEDAADAIQETILTCWEKLDSLNHNCYTIGGAIVIPEPIGVPKKDEAFAGFELRYED